jgi:hypothetical protein
MAVIVIADQELTANIVRKQLGIGRQEKEHINRHHIDLGVRLAMLLTEFMFVQA